MALFLQGVLLAIACSSLSVCATVQVTWRLLALVSSRCCLVSGASMAVMGASAMIPPFGKLVRYTSRRPPDVM